MTNQIQDTLDFSKHLSFDDYICLRDHDLSQPESDAYSMNHDEQSEYGIWLKKDRELFGAVIPKAMNSFLAELKKSGRLKPVCNSENISTSFINAWNAISKAEKLEDAKSALDVITGRFESTMMLRICLGHLPAEEGYKKYCETMTQGDISHFKTEVNETCSITGERAIIEFRNWECVFGNYVNGKFCVSGPTEKRPSVFHQSIEFKTGNLLIADWFRINEFTKTVKQENQPSLDSEHGRELQTKYYAEKFGFISVCLGNTCPSILENNGKLIIGTVQEKHEESKSPEFKDHGYVCTDLWAATIIEEETLINIVAGKVGLEKAKTLVADHLTENDVARVKVTPGQYHLYFHGDYDGFHKSFSTDGLDLSNVCDPLFVISNEQLVLKDPKLTKEDSPVRVSKNKPAK